MFAVFKTGGKQYRVAAEDVVLVEKLAGEAGDAVAFTEVLMVGDEGSATIGTPLVAGATVAGELVEQTRGPKVYAFKKRRRKNSRRKKGHRQHLSMVRITEILTGGASPRAAAKAKREAAPAAEVEAKPAKAPKAAAKAEAAMKPLFTAPEGAADDLKKIAGVGPVLEKKLNALGITTYAQIAAFTPEDLARVDEVLNFKGRIEREDWIAQAKALANGQ